MIPMGFVDTSVGDRGMDPLRGDTEPKRALEFAMDNNQNWAVFIILKRCFGVKNTDNFEQFKYSRYNFEDIMNDETVDINLNSQLKSRLSK